MRLPETRRRSLLAVFGGQFKSPLIYLLFAAAAIALALGHASDAVVIGVVVVVNAVIGAFQEGRAERSLEALRKLTAHRARVVRDRQETLVEARRSSPATVLAARGRRRGRRRRAARRRRCATDRRGRADRRVGPGRRRTCRRWLPIRRSPIDATWCTRARTSRRGVRARSSSRPASTPRSVASRRWPRRAKRRGRRSSGASRSSVVTSSSLRSSCSRLFSGSASRAASRSARSSWSASASSSA